MKNPLGIFDIGSNTVLMTCGRLDPKGELEVLLEGHDVARLSEGLIDGGPLGPSAKGRVLDILKKFKQEAEAQGVRQFLGAGTAAFRRAADGKNFAEEIKKQTGIPVVILTGEQEAHYSYQSAQRDFGEGAQGVGMVDIGGGSTELVFGNEKNSISLALGTVLLLEKFVRDQPIPDALWKTIKSHIRRILEESPLPSEDIPKRWVAVAATPTALATLIQELKEFDPLRVHGFVLNKDVLQSTVEKLRIISVAERNLLRGMMPKRAELLPLGGIILWEVLDYLGLRKLTVSHHGLRYGILWEKLSVSRDVP